MTIAYQTPQAQGAAYNRGLHWLAWLTTLATFPLIFMGGLVTSKDAGLSVPDWPNSYGYNMFLFPPSKWVANIFFEHTHRLLGTLVGFFAVWTFFWAWGVGRNSSLRKGIFWGMVGSLGVSALAAGGLMVFHKGSLDEKLQTHVAHGIVGLVSLALFLFSAWTSRQRETRGWIRWLSVIVLVGVIIQGILGGLRVTMVKLDLAIIHGCVAQAFFCLGALLVVATSKWWMWTGSEEARREQPRPRPMRGMIALAVLTWLVIYGQLILGATMRHYRAGLAIPDLPLAYGRWLPPMTSAELSAAKDRVPAPEHDADDTPVPVTPLGQVWLAYSHRVGAVVVSAFVIGLALLVLKKHAARGLETPAALLLVLLQAQLTLGVLVVLLKKPADITSYHVAVGALVLLTALVLLVRAIRVWWIFRPARMAVNEASTAPLPVAVERGAGVAPMGT